MGQHDKIKIDYFHTLFSCNFPSATLFNYTSRQHMSKEGEESRTAFGCLACGFMCYPFWARFSPSDGMQLLDS